MKKIYFLILITFFISCGKKEPPPSPDIFAPGIVEAVYSINNQINITFTEVLDNKVDSVFLMNDTMRNKENDCYTNKTVLTIQYNNDEGYKSIDVFGIGDKFDNKKNYIGIPIKGAHIIDTIPPFVERVVFQDSVIRIVFSEIVDTFEVEIYPLYIKTMEIKTEKNRINVYIDDTINLYQKEVIVSDYCDKHNNIGKTTIRYEQYSDSSYNSQINIEKYKPFEYIYLLRDDSLVLYRGLTDSLGNYSFKDLLRGIYYIQNDSIIKKIAD